MGGVKRLARGLKLHCPSGAFLRLSQFGLHRIDAFARLCDSAGARVPAFCAVSLSSQSVLDFGRVESTGTRGVGLVCINDCRLSSGKP
jgi:hypothetical protein